MTDSQLRDHYERKYAGERAAATIRGIERTDSPVNREQAALKYLAGRLHGSVLELGAGDGAVAAALLAACPAITGYTLGDISAPRIEGVARRLRDPRVRTLLVDAEAVDPAGESYDALVMIALVEHLIDPLRALQRLRAVLRPGGFLYLDTPNIAKYTRRLQLLRGRFPSTASGNEGLTTYEGQPVDLHDEGHLHYFSFRSLSLLLTQRCGFSRVEVCPYACGRLLLGRALETRLARQWPGAFSELAVMAYA